MIEPAAGFSSEGALVHATTGLSRRKHHLGGRIPVRVRRPIDPAMNPSALDWVCPLPMMGLSRFVRRAVSDGQVAAAQQAGDQPQQASRLRDAIEQRRRDIRRRCLRQLQRPWLRVGRHDGRVPARRSSMCVAGVRQVARR